MAEVELLALALSVDCAPAAPQNMLNAMNEIKRCLRMGFSLKKTDIGL
jgi:hypothetical protein